MMKSRFNCFIAVIAVLAIGFTSCSKDSGPTPAQDIAKEYRGTELVVTNAGESVPDGVMKIEAVDNTNATVTLSSIVNGQPSFAMSAVVSQSETGYAFEGKKDIDGMKVAVKGLVVDGKASVDVTTEIVAAEILGTWRFSSSMNEGEGSPISFAIKNKTGKLIYYDEDGSETETETDGIYGFNGSIEMMGGLALGMALTDFSFTFQSNGYVGIKGKVGMPDKTDIDMPKLARYYYNPTTKMLIFDAPLGGLLGKATSPILGGTMQVPFQCTFENGQLLAVVEPNFVNGLLSLVPAESVDVLIGMLGTVIPSEGLFVSKEYILGLVKTILVAITDKENFESLTLGGRLVPVEEL